MKFLGAMTLAALAILAAGRRVEYPIDIRVSYQDEPYRGTSGEVHTYASGGIYFCINDNFNPPCVNVAVPFDACIDVDPDWNDKISAVGPNGGSECEFFLDYGCNGKHVGPVGYGGYPDLRKVGNGEFNDAISSFKCFGRTYS